MSTVLVNYDDPVSLRQALEHQRSYWLDQQSRWNVERRALQKRAEQAKARAAEAETILGIASANFDRQVAYTREVIAERDSLEEKLSALNEDASQVHFQVMKWADEFFINGPALDALKRAIVP
jgi:hypothetical protein